MTYLGGLSAASCLVVGVFAALAAALVGIGWRPRPWQRAILIAAFVGLGLAAFHNDATERLLGLPRALVEPKASQFCPAEDETGEEPAPPPPPPPAEQPGCALVKRAYELGYAKDLGDCAPKQAEAAAPVEVGPGEVCTMRQRDEPYLHHAWRQLADAAGGVTDTDPVAAARRRIDAMSTRLDYLDTLVARQLHAIGGSPHASHHLWIELPDPRGGTWLGDLLSPPRCDDRYAELPLWPGWTGAAASPGALVEHVLGQLLFATRFGKPPGSCRDYVLHWDAPDDACARLADDPARFLDEQGALEPVRAVLDRRRRQIEVRALAVALGERPRFAEPPAAEQVVSLHCFLVDPAGTGVPTGRMIELDGQPLGVRQVVVPAVEVSGAGPIDVYARLAALLAGGHGGPAGDAALARIGAPPPAADELAADDYLLSRMERLHAADPFLGTRWPLERADLADVYPFHHHVHAFVDAFRRRYRAQRGRL